MTPKHFHINKNLSHFQRPLWWWRTTRTCAPCRAPTLEPGCGPTTHRRGCVDGLEVKGRSLGGPIPRCWRCCYWNNKSISATFSAHNWHQLRPILSQYICALFVPSIVCVFMFFEMFKNSRKAQTEGEACATCLTSTTLDSAGWWITGGPLMMLTLWLTWKCARTPARRRQ